MPALYLIGGVPGSGKSTLAQQLVTTGLVTAAYEADQFLSMTESINLGPTNCLLRTVGAKNKLSPAL